MSRPRLMYVPIAVGIEAEPVIERVDWGEVATLDVPGAGANRDLEWSGIAGVCRAAIRRLDELGWERCAVICDSHAQAAGIELALSHPERVDAIAIGHAAARYAATGDRPALNPSILEAAAQLLDTDFRSFGRAITQLTRGARTDEQVDAWIASVPEDVARRTFHDLLDAEPALVSRLSDSDLPVVLCQHRGCMMWTDEGFEDAVAAVPDARTIVTEGAPTEDPTFLAAIRETVPG